MVDDLLTLKEAAEMTGYTEATLRTYVKRGEIPFHQRKPGAMIRFRRSQLEAWMTGEWPPKEAA